MLDDDRLDFAGDFGQNERVAEVRLERGREGPDVRGMFASSARSKTKKS